MMYFSIFTPPSISPNPVGFRGTGKYFTES